MKSSLYTGLAIIKLSLAEGIDQLVSQSVDYKIKKTLKISHQLSGRV